MKPDDIYEILNKAFGGEKIEENLNKINLDNFTLI
jgi:hypothetical protein